MDIPLEKAWKLVELIHSMRTRTFASDQQAEELGPYIDKARDRYEELKRHYSFETSSKTALAKAIMSYAKEKL